MWQRAPDGQGIFVDAGEMRPRCEATDWTATPLGSLHDWSAALRSAVQATVAAGFPTILLWGPTLLQVYNDAYRKVMGAEHPVGLGESTRDYWPAIWNVAPQLFERVFQGETVVVEDALYSVTRYGYLEDLHFAVSLSPVREDGGDVAGFVMTFFETTAQVAARTVESARELQLRALGMEHARLARLFREAPEFLAVLHAPDYVVAQVNDAFVELVGVRDLIGRTLYDAMPELEGQGFVKLLDEVLSTGKSFVGRQLPIRLARLPGGALEERFVDFIYQPLTDPDGTRVGIVVHGSDVTAHVRARRDVERLLQESEQARKAVELARAQAEEASRAKAEFLATMSHELRTPLNAIGGYVDLLNVGVYGSINPRQMQALERIQASQRHLLGLINTVLNFARVETGGLAYNFSDVMLAEVLATIETLVVLQMRERELTFHCESRDPLLRVRVDREKLQQIILNLLSNAVKFTPPTGTITLGSAVDGDCVSIYVADTGPGIPAERLEGIFDPFVQVDSRLTRTQEGMGLGLSISRDLARGMGGELSAESVEGKGSVFTLTVPRA